MRVVAKIGTASITDDRGVIDAVRHRQARPTRSPALRADGHEVIVVSSGAVAAGVAALGLPAPTDRHADAAGDLGGRSEPARRGLQPRARLATVSSARRCCSTRTTSSIGRSTCTPVARSSGCSSSGCVPVVNENDAIANDELRYGDNDRLAALVANSVGADVLVLLTDMDGVYTADPRRDPSGDADPAGARR